MNAERLLQHFERISEVPDAIPRLRRFILDLAVRGKLVEQDPSDEPAAELLKRIQAEKAQWAKEGKGRQAKALPTIPEDQYLFFLPNNWIWSRLGEVITLLSGQHLQPNEYSENDQSGLPYVTGPADFGVAGLTISRYALVRKAVATKGQLLLTVKGAGVGKTATCDIPEVAISRQLMALTAIQWSQCFLVLATHMLAETLKEKARSLIPGISRDDVELFVFGFPPLAEQHRIVAKVDKLMALCDQLEAAKTEREQSCVRLVAASLHRLNSPADAAETNAPDLPARQADAFRDHARFVFNHLPRLTTRPEHITQLRQTILNLAVRGKLVPQDSHDEPVVELSNSIGCDDAELAPFSLPDTWKWAKVQEIADTRLGKMLDQAKNKGTERRYLRNVNVRWFDFELSDVLTMRFEESELEEFSLRVGDVLICEGGEPGRAAVWDGRENNIYFQKAIHRVRFAQGVNPHYFVYVIKESADSGRLAGYFTGVGIKHFTGKGLSSLLVPLPPLAEQHRIVARVDELMALCDQLEAELIATDADSRRLLEAVLHEALNPLAERTERP